MAGCWPCCTSGRWRNGLPFSPTTLQPPLESHGPLCRCGFLIDVFFGSSRTRGDSASLRGSELVARHLQGPRLGPEAPQQDSLPAGPFACGALCLRGTLLWGTLGYFALRGTLPAELVKVQMGEVATNWSLLGFLCNSFGRREGGLTANRHNDGLNFKFLLFVRYLYLWGILGFPIRLRDLFRIGYCQLSLLVKKVG